MESYFPLTSGIKCSFTLCLPQPTDIVMSRTQMHEVKQHLEIFFFAITDSDFSVNSLTEQCLYMNKLGMKTGWHLTNLDRVRDKNMSVWRRRVNRIWRVWNERACCDIIIITLGKSKRLFIHSWSASYFPLNSNVLLNNTVVAGAKYPQFVTAN